MNQAVVRQNGADHVGWPDAKLQDIRVGNIRPSNLIKHHVEQGQPSRSRDEAVGPPPNKRGIVVLVLRANETSHVPRFPSNGSALLSYRTSPSVPTSHAWAVAAALHESQRTVPVAA